MSIPKLLQDLAVIQKLSDLPNSTDGLTAQELKAKFDEAALAVQTYLNERLIPALTAAQLPFTPTAEVNAANIQDAIAAVQGQIRDAVSGTLVNGSVTKEKLSEALLERVFGGRPWVSMVEPGSADNVDAEFPVGQIWLRPGFTVVNAAGDSWAGNGCTVTDGVVVGDKTSAVATCMQTLTNIGQAGDRVLVLFDITAKNAEVSGITVSFNGEAAQDAAAGMFETTLTDNGSLTVQFTTTWNSASLAQEGWTLEDYTVVNPDLVLRQVEDAQEPADWAAFVLAFTPFTSKRFPEELYIQTASGIWWPLLAGSEVENGYLRTVGGRPVWTDRETVASDLGALRMATGSYTGTGVAGSVTLSVVPKLLFLAPVNGPWLGTGSSAIFDNPEVLMNGTTIARTAVDDSGSNNISIRNYLSLEGDVLHLQPWSSGNTTTLLMNRKGEPYTWIALY